jgi:biopolymer transport protein ExbB
MWPLLLLSVFAIYVIINRAVFWLNYVPRTDDALNSVLRGRSQTAAARGDGELALVLSRGIRDSNLNSASAELALERELLKAARFLNSLDTVAMVAPMLGLLGTVSGMVQVFQRVAAEQGAVNPSLLADGIWSALLTTAFGLIVAIPALAAYRYFRSRLIRWENRLRTCVDDALRLSVTAEKGAFPSGRGLRKVMDAAKGVPPAAEDEATKGGA